MVVILPFFAVCPLGGGAELEKVQELLMTFPVIAAVKDETELRRALDSDCPVVFLLFGSIVSVESLVQRVKSRGKVCFVHIDLVEGLSNREVAVDGLVKLCSPDGIISTRSPSIRRARQLGILAIQRVFMLDSMSLKNLLLQLDTVSADFIEILPGILPGVIQEIARKTDIPLIAGGLIRSKQDVIQALQAGVLAVSTSCPDVWQM